MKEFDKLLALEFISKYNIHVLNQWWNKLHPIRFRYFFKADGELRDMEEAFKVEISEEQFEYLTSNHYVIEHSVLKYGDMSLLMISPSGENKLKSLIEHKQEVN